MPEQEVKLLQRQLYEFKASFEAERVRREERERAAANEMKALRRDLSELRGWIKRGCGIVLAAVLIALVGLVLK